MNERAELANALEEAEQEIERLEEQNLMLIQAIDAMIQLGTKTLALPAFKSG